jgi:hypothetical protein
MSTEQLEFGGIVVADAEWNHYLERTAGGDVLEACFDGDGGQITRVWRDPSGGGGLLCQKGFGGEVAPMFRYSDVMADPNTEALSGSARFLQRLVAGGMALEAALSLTVRLYSRVPHSRDMPQALVDRILEQWRNQTNVGRP